MTESLMKPNTDQRFVIELGPMVIKTMDGEEFWESGKGPMKWTGVPYGGMVMLQGGMLDFLNGLHAFGAAEVAEKLNMMKSKKAK